MWHSWGDAAMIFTCDFVTYENHCQISSFMTKNVIHANPHIILYIIWLLWFQWTYPNRYAPHWLESNIDKTWQHAKLCASVWFLEHWIKKAPTILLILLDIRNQYNIYIEVCMAWSGKLLMHLRVCYFELYFPRRSCTSVLHITFWWGQHNRLSNASWEPAIVTQACDICLTRYWFHSLWYSRLVM